MSEVTSVNGHTGAVVLTAADVEAVPTSAEGKPSGVATLDGGGALHEGQLPTSVVSSSANPGEEAEVPISAGSGSNGIKWQKKMRLDARDYGVKGTEAAKEGEALQAAVTAANERKRELWLPDEAKIKLTTAVKLENPEHTEWRMRGAGRGTQIIDAVTGGPSLRMAFTGEPREGAPTWHDFDIVLGCQKAAFNMVEFVGLQTSGFELEGVHWQGDAAVNFWRCLAGLYMENLWEGALNSCWWHSLLGHSVIYRCPTAGNTSGNVKFDTCQDLFCINGMYIDGLETQNNITFDTCKWTNSINGHEYYQALTSGIPEVGATTITVAMGQEAKYFQRNGCVVLFSAQGAEIVHIADEANPYNSETGVLKLRDAVAKNHHATADMRLIAATFSVVTNFIVNSLEFDGCHMEQRPAVILNAPGMVSHGMSFHLNQSANTGEPRGLYYGGAESCDAKVIGSTMAHSFETYSEYSMVYGLQPTGITGNPSIEIDGVASSPTPNKVSREEPKWNPLKGDGTFLAFANQKVRTLGHGTERNTIPGDSSFRVARKVAASANVKSNDEVVNCETPTANITITLLKVANKIVTVRKIDSVAHNVIITAGAGKTITTKAGVTAETVEITAKGACFTIWYDGTNFWEQ